MRLLEIDTAPTTELLVFTRWDLGTDPLDVLDALTDAGYAGRLSTPRMTPPREAGPTGRIGWCVPCGWVRRW